MWGFTVWNLPDFAFSCLNLPNSLESWTICFQLSNSIFCTNPIFHFANPTSYFLFSTKPNHLTSSALSHGGKRRQYKSYNHSRHLPTEVERLTEVFRTLYTDPSIWNCRPENSFEIFSFFFIVFVLLRNCPLNREFMQPIGQVTARFRTSQTATIYLHSRWPQNSFLVTQNRCYLFMAVLQRIHGLRGLTVSV